MNFKNQESSQKLRGGYYTPQLVAETLSCWALSDRASTVLEPGCGDGSFLQAIYRQRIASSQTSPLSIEAVEIIAEEAAKAEIVGEKLQATGAEVTIVNEDVFAWLRNKKVEKKWNAIIGNPPYIRYQYFDEVQRDSAEMIFKQANIPFSKRTNAWVPIVIASVMHLAPGGRLAMVVPAELLHIHYAAGLRQFLEQEMEAVTLVSIREMVFPGVLQGVVLLLAVKKRNRNFQPLLYTNQETLFPLPPDIIDGPVNFQIVDINGVDDLYKTMSGIDQFAQKSLVKTNGEWMFGLLSDEETALLEKIKQHPCVRPFVSIASVDIGIVTGANDFFVVNEQTMREFHLESIATPMLAKSDLIKGITYTLQDHEANARAGKSVHFLSFPAQPLADLPPGMREYLKLGQEQKLQERYKCRIREPWYVVPYVWASELSLLKRCHFYPKLVVNELKAYSTDTAYRVRLERRYQGREKDMSFSFLNSLTFLYAELGGRHYGGGVLEMVPSEIEKLLIPFIPIEDQDFARVDCMIRADVGLDELVDFTDTVLLHQGLGLAPSEIDVIRKAHRRLMKRRLRA